MNKIDDVKVWAREEYGLEILTSNQKRAKELIADKSQKENYALVVTGTQDEPYSSLNRAARDLLPAHRYSLSKSDVIVFSQGLIPVKDNAHRRKILQKTVQEFHGATVLLPETITQESFNHTIKGPNGALAIAASGHSGPKGKKWLLETSGAKTLIPIHGNKSQITAQAKMSENLGVEYLVLDGSTTVLVEKEKPVKKIGAFLSKTIGIKSHLPSPEQFYLKGHFTPIALAKLPLHPHPAAELIGKFEAVTRRNAEVDSPFELKETLPASLSPIFNLTADTHGYMAQKIPFGIQKYPHSVLEEKGIFAIGAFDFETGGLNTNDHLAREYAMSVEDTDGNILEEVQIFQEIPTYRAPSPMALLVTNTNPYDLTSGIKGNLNAQDFSQQMSESLKGVKDLSLAAALKKNPDAEYKKKDMKALVIAHNASFDSNVVVRELGRNLHMHRRPHQTRGVVTLDTKAVSRSLYAFSANGEYKVSYYEGTDIPNHKLESLCDMNGISYDQVAAHGGLEDTKPLKALYKKQLELSPDVVGQMVINADKSTGHLINDIRGTHNGFGDGPHPVFSYVSPFASRPKAQMGAYVGTFQSERFLIVMNLKYDPEKILTLPPEDILKILQNGNDDRLELLDRNACPIIMPASFGLKVRANGSLTKGSLDARANMVKKHINYVDPKQDWKSLPNKLDKLYQEHWEDIYRARIVKAYLKTEKAMPQYGENVPTPEAGVRALLKLGISKFKPHHQEVVKRVRIYASAVQTGMKSEMTEAYKNIRALRGHEVFERNSKISMDEVMDAVNNVHYDIRPADLSVKDAHRIEMMRHYMGYQHFKKAKEEILLLENDKDQYAQYIGDDKKKKAIFNKIKKWVKEESPKFELTDDVRAFIRPVRSITQPENDNSSTLKRSLA
jgi:DNA polymerase III epsilon subunit-like protein